MLCHFYAKEEEEEDNKAVPLISCFMSFAMMNLFNPSFLLFMGIIYGYSSWRSWISGNPKPKATPVDHDKDGLQNKITGERTGSFYLFLSTFWPFKPAGFSSLRICLCQTCLVANLNLFTCRVMDFDLTNLFTFLENLVFSLPCHEPCIVSDIPLFSAKKKDE